MTSSTCYHERVRWALICAIAGSVAQAAPQVEIRAKTQLSITSVQTRDEGLPGPDGPVPVAEVTLLLSDKLTGDPIGNQLIEVRLPPRPFITVRTEADGTYRLPIHATAGPQTIIARYTGGGAFERAETLTTTVDPSKLPVQLAIVKIADDPAGPRMQVNAEAGPLSVEVALSQTGKDTWKALQPVETGKPFVLSRRDAGGPGAYRMRARFAGDDLHQAATTEATIELASSTTTTLDVKSTSLAFEDDLVAVGTVVDDDRQPIARAAISLTSGDRRLAQTATGSDGGFRLRVEAELIGEGQHGIQVQADPSQPFVRPSRSDPVIVNVSSPRPVPVSHTFAAFVLTALAATGFFAARTKPWLRFRRPAPPAEVPSEQGEVGVQHGGLTIAKPGIVSTLRRAADDGFAGVVRDTVRGRPIAEAVVCLRFGDTEREVRTTADGGFAMEHLGVGEWHAEIAAVGHVTEKFAVTIPHRGELRGVRIDLVPVRERVFQLYRRAAEPILPEPRLWGIWSPRQIVDHVRRKRPSPALAELTDFVEEVYFSPRLVSEGVLPQTQERVDRAVHERAGR
jgi:hypothetical protein